MLVWYFTTTLLHTYINEWDILTTFCVVAIGSVMARAKALPMMHHHSREFVEEVLWARRTRGAGTAGTGAGKVFRRRAISAAVRLHVQKLIETHVDSDLLPVVPPRPPGGWITGCESTLNKMYRSWKRLLNKHLQTETLSKQPLCFVF